MKLTKLKWSKAQKDLCFPTQPLRLICYQRRNQKINFYHFVCKMTKTLALMLQYHHRKMWRRFTKRYKNLVKRISYLLWKERSSLKNSCFVSSHLTTHFSGSITLLQTSCSIIHLPYMLLRKATKKVFLWRTFMR